MQADPASIMIFAAGFGTRMGALTKTRPKPLIEVNGRNLIDHALDLAGPLNLPITVNTHYHADMMAAHLRDRPDVTISQETPDILETGGGLKQALRMMPEGPVVTLNSDAIWSGPNPLELLTRAWDPSRMEALLMLISQARCVAYDRGGNFEMGPDGRLVRDMAGLVYTGAQIIKPNRVAATRERSFSLNPIWDEMIATQSVFGLQYPGRWADVGTPDGIIAAEELLHDV